MLVIAGESIVLTSRSTDRPAAPDTWASGAPAIAAWVAARLGAPAVFLSAVGDDEDGRLIASTLSEAGVDTTGLAIRPGRPTARATVEYRPDGSRRFDFAVADSAAPTLEVADLGDWPERARWVHVSGSAVLFGDPMAAAVEELVARGRKAGATVSVDPNLRAELTDAAARARLSQLCRQAHVLFPSDEELRELGLDEDELVAAGVTVCTTAAAEGARLRRPHAEEVFVPAIARPEEVVDPDGAGDTFAGATIAARLAGLDWQEAVAVASAVVARAIAVPGAMTVDLAAFGPLLTRHPRGGSMSTH
jgi:sugar/nucleoside kinase (ribokinase family)